MTDPISLSLLAVSAAGVVSFCRSEHRRRSGGRPPSTLSEMFAAITPEGVLPCPMLAVHVHTAKLAPGLAREGLIVRVKVGEEGCSSKCDTPETLATHPVRSAASWFVPKLPQRKEQEYAVADFGSTCLFQVKRKSSAFLRLRIMHPGALGRTVARASLRLTCSGMKNNATLEETELPLYGTGLHVQKVVGTISLSADMCNVRKEVLGQYCQLLQIQRTHGAFRVVPTLVAQGSLDDADEEPAVLGQAAEPIQPSCVTGPATGQRTVGTSTQPH